MSDRHTIDHVSAGPHKRSGASRIAHVTCSNGRLLPWTTFVGTYQKLALSEWRVFRPGRWWAAEDVGKHYLD
jgi:hypothetical protein